MSQPLGPAQVPNIGLLVPKAIALMVFGTGVLKHGVLGPSGYGKSLSMPRMAPERTLRTVFLNPGSEIYT